MDLKVCDDLLDLSGDLYLCMEGLSLFLILRVDFVPGPALASTTCKVKSTLYTIYHKLKIPEGEQWLSGRVLDSRPRGRGFEPHPRH